MHPHALAHELSERYCGSERSKMKCLLVLVSAVLVAAADDVLEFDDANFKTEIVKHDIILVEFFAPW